MSVTLRVPMYRGRPRTFHNETENVSRGTISQFIATNYRHFNARELRQAAEAYNKLIDDGGKMFVSMAGAMSTGELGISLAKMIRAGKVHAICPTGANLEEDLFNLVAGTKYESIPDYRLLDPEDETKILEAGLSRVTDTAIPEEAAMNKISGMVEALWKEADKHGTRAFPHEYLYEVIESGKLEDHYDTEPENSWLLAAYEKKLPIFVPGWEDSTLGNKFAAMCLKKEIKDPLIVKGGIEYMMALAEWYREESGGKGIGFFQIGGGISGDFPICVVPMLKADIKEERTPFWAYFCQISDAVTSYGGYSGASPNEKITWQKIDKRTPAFMIQSDASIVCPLIFSYVLGE